MDDNALCIDWSKYDIEINETEPDEDFLLVERLQKVAVNYDAVDVFEDIQIRHNETTDDHLEIIVAAIRRRMKQVAKQLVADGLAEDEESVCFALRYGQINGCKYVFDIQAEEFDPDKLHTIDCEDWNDCSDIAEMLLKYWPDRLVGYVVYDGKFYTGSCESIDDFRYNVDLVDCNLESVQ